jgi:hypothetical protein
VGGSVPKEFFSTWECRQLAKTGSSSKRRLRLEDDKSVKGSVARVNHRSQEVYFFNLRERFLELTCLKRGVRRHLCLESLSVSGPERLRGIGSVSKFTFEGLKEKSAAPQRRRDALASCARILE